tara:strand:- start:410 stop:550 length:141 start_codon:yes stop_codon:yes gene_type:complete
MKNLVWAEILKKEISVLEERIKERGTGHIRTAIDVLKRRVEELENE